MNEIHTIGNVNSLKCPNKVKKFNWKKFKEYVDTYDPKKHGLNNGDIIFLDMLYGIGIAVDPNGYSCAGGFKRFMNYLSTRIRKSSDCLI